MKFSYNWIKEYVDVKDSPEDVADKLTMHSFEVENIVRDGDDYVFNIDILPNRMGDASSHLGVAREVAVLYKKELKIPQVELKEDKGLKAGDLAKVSVEEKNICPRYSARVIADVRVGPSPAWLKQRLESVGLRPINNIVDAANFVMLELGQPLHAFDLGKVEGGTIVVRRAKKDEPIETLDGDKYKLGKRDIVIADNKKVLGIAGIKGGVSSGIDKKTKNILLESANFDQVSIRNTSRALRLHTDASARFSSGISPYLTTTALNRLAQMVIELSGGRLASGVIDVKEKLPSKRAVGFSLRELNQFLGLEINKKEVVRILEALNFKVKEKDDKISIVVPDERIDIERKEDVYEEIGRIVGYKNIKPAPLRSEIRPVGVIEERDFRFRVKDVLSNMGFYEAVNYIFLSGKDLEVEGIKEKNAWELLNPISSDKQFLRQSLLSGVLKNISDSQRFYDESSFFEVGKVYIKEGGEPKEEWAVVMALAEKDPVDTNQVFYALKGRVEAFLEKLGIIGVSANHIGDKTNVPSGLSPIKSAHLAGEDNKTIGFLGELDPAIVDFYNIKGSAVLAIFNLLDLLEFALVDKFFKEIPKFPPLKRDIAILVPADVRMVEIENVIYNATSGGNLIDVDLFDIYEGLEEGAQKSMAFHLIFQSDKKTLTKKEVDLEEGKIKKSLEDKLDAVIR